MRQTAQKVEMRAADRARPAHPDIGHPCRPRERRSAPQNGGLPQRLESGLFRFSPGPLEVFPKTVKFGGCSPLMGRGRGLAQGLGI